MKKWKLTWACLILGSLLYANPKNDSDTFQLNNRAISFLQSKVRGIDFKTCSEEIIFSYIKKDFNIADYERYNEFDKKKYMVLVRDTLSKMQQEYSFKDVYGYTTKRLIGDYNFDKNQFPIVGHYYTNGGRFSYKSYKDESQVILEHLSMGLNLVNAEMFPLALKFSEDEAEKILNTQKQMRKEYLDSLYNTMDPQTKIFNQRKGIKFNDDYGNYAENEDRTVYFRYFVRVLDPLQNKSIKKKAARFINSLVNPSGVQKIEEDPNALKVEIVKVEVYLKGGIPATKKELYNYYPSEQQKLFHIQ